MTSATKSKKDKKEKPQQQHGQERLKIVIRRLPPNLPEDLFWQSVQQWVSDDTVTWKSYHQGKFRSRYALLPIIPGGSNVIELLLQLEQGEHLKPCLRCVQVRRTACSISPRLRWAHLQRQIRLVYVVRHLYEPCSADTPIGNESQAVVEYAPYQKVPSDKKKADARLGTIEQDEDYISFIQTLNQPTTEAVTIETLVASLQPVSQPKTTPLLEALKAEKVAAKEAKEKMIMMRNHHAHPPEVLTRKDDKKKATSAKAAAEVPPTSKKAAKKAAAVAAAAANVDPAHAGSPTSRKSGKASRAREQQQHLSPAQVASPSAAAAPSTSAATTNDATAPPSRRSRPVLGLGSRQFEAALSGVAGGKSRKDREKDNKDKEKEKEKEPGQESTQEKKAAQPPANGESSKPKETGSPKRERTARRRDSTGVPATGKSQTVPGILQRGGAPPPAILKREDKPAARAGTEPDASHQGPPPGLGRGRGRGRGRGARGGGSMGRGG
ncbi:hypothetical protein AAF712_001793 [Marasmius tenuissimus]|uniref:UPF3 domain-containing protein n=1 Tax=Marasmius tenuissimus TaxID=585030 RepID=A0ABR3ACX5_9AGAR